MLEQGTISIHTENIFPIIKKSLYSDHQIFLRELVSNAVDAIQKLNMVSSSGEYSGEIGETEIQIAIDKSKKTLSITDNGIGMTANEVKKYINQVAFSSAQEFVQKYQGNSDSPIIGNFGLGFYSSFMVASKVEIDTLSYKDSSQAVHWSCDGSPNFTLQESSRSSRGTTITLYLMEEEQEYLESERVKNLVKTYCDFMPIPIKMSGEQLNKQKASWRDSPSSISKEDYLEFYRYLYPFQEEPLLWVHLNTDYPFIINGILYFPKLKPDVDVTKGQIKLFCNQVFVSDNCEEIIPQFLLPMRGVIDSTDIPLNVSRSALQGNRTVKKIGDYIAKKVGDRLKELYRNDRQQYINVWRDLSTFVKFGVLNDEKFKKQVEDLIIFRSTANSGSKTVETPVTQIETEKGDVWENVASSSSENSGNYYTTLKEYLERNKAIHENKVFYSTDEAFQATYIELYKSQSLEVLFMDSFIDTHFINLLEQEYKNVKFTRVDSDLDNTLLDKDKSGEIVNPKTNKTRSDSVKELFEKAINKPKVNIRTEALKSETQQATPPAMVLLPEILRRLRDMNALMQQQNLEFPEEHVLLLNTSHPLIQSLVELSQGGIIQGDGESHTGKLVKMMCQHVYDLALMSQKGFDAEGMKSFVERSNHVLTKLAEEVAK